MPACHTQLMTMNVISPPNSIRSVVEKYSDPQTVKDVLVNESHARCVVELLAQTDRGPFSLDVLSARARQQLAAPEPRKKWFPRQIHLVGTGFVDKFRKKSAECGHADATRTHVNSVLFRLKACKAVEQLVTSPPVWEVTGSGREALKTFAAPAAADTPAEPLAACGIFTPPQSDCHEPRDDEDEEETAGTPASKDGCASSDAQCQQQLDSDAAADEPPAAKRRRLEPADHI